VIWLGQATATLAVSAIELRCGHRLRTSPPPADGALRHQTGPPFPCTASGIASHTDRYRTGSCGPLLHRARGATPVAVAWALIHRQDSRFAFAKMRRSGCPLLGAKRPDAPHLPAGANWRPPGARISPENAFRPSMSPISSRPTAASPLDVG